MLLRHRRDGAVRTAVWQIYRPGATRAYWRPGTAGLWGVDDPVALANAARRPAWSATVTVSPYWADEHARERDAPDAGRDRTSSLGNTVLTRLAWREVPQRCRRSTSCSSATVTGGSQRQRHAWVC